MSIELVSVGVMLLDLICDGVESVTDCPADYQHLEFEFLVSFELICETLAGLGVRSTAYCCYHCCC